MITAIEIENFKGFGERQRIEIAPITLLFGANSAGKSSFFHALFYLRELFAGNDPTPGVANYFSDRIDLGGFRNTVHDHDDQRDIRFRIEFEVGDEARFGRRIRDFDLGEGKIMIEVVVGFWKEENSRSDGITVVDKAIIREYSVHIGEHCDHFKFLPMISLRTVEKAKPKGSWTVGLTADVENLSDYFEIRGERPDKRDRYECRVTLSHGALPSGLRTQNPDESKDFYLTDAINGVLYASKEYLRTCLEDLFYIGPWREMPDSQHISQSSIQRSRWAGGLAAWDMIMDSISPTFRIRLNYQLERLLGIHIKRQRLYPEVQYSDRDFLDRLIVESAGDCESGIGPGKILRVQDVGYGVSQIVPFVVALIMEEYKTVAIEQPELHLHPKLQAELGDFIISECIAGPYDTQAIIETHSQHLLLRIKRRIRETMKGTVSEGLRLSPHEVSVNYLHQENGETKIIPIHLDLNGEFVEPWPDDFFDLDLNERFS